MPGLVKRRRLPSITPPPGVTREDSDDELGTDDYPWDWIYEHDDDEDDLEAELEPKLEAELAPGDVPGSRKRKRTKVHHLAPRIVGARMGNFECRVGDTVLLKAEGSNEAWVGIVYEFLDDEEGEKAANFMWFSSEKEIRNGEKKRKDFVENELYITPSFDINSLTTINGKAQVMSHAEYLKKYPSGKVPRKAKEFGKVFICRRGCNTRTCTYTDEFIWEDVYGGIADIDALKNLVKNGTRPTRRKRNISPKDGSPEVDYSREAVDDDDGDDPAAFRTPSKKTKFRDAGDAQQQA